MLPTSSATPPTTAMTNDRLQRKRPLSIGGCLKCADVDNGLCRRVGNAAIPKGRETEHDQYAMPTIFVALLNRRLPMGEQAQQPVDAGME